MKRILVAILISSLLSVISFDYARSQSRNIDKARVISEVEDKQKEYVDEHNILMKQLDDLNNELMPLINRWNSGNTTVSLSQSISKVRSKMIAIKEQESRNDGRYINYLEQALSALSNGEFNPLEMKWESR
jgi:septal ring factor EnvC (AmiA/AmiB activator)